MALKSVKACKIFKDTNLVALPLHSQGSVPATVAC